MSENQFKPAWWLPNSHLQTIWPTFCRSRIRKLPLERERLEMPDGDFIDLDWLDKNNTGVPLVIILHGFEGSIDSPYARGMMQKINEQGWRCVFMHFRGCSGEPNRLPRGYHSGETADVSCMIKMFRQREPDVPIAAIGYSLGGNVLLKWLGETGCKNPLKAAIAISVPFELQKAADRIQQGFSRLYQWYFLKCIRERLLNKFQSVPPHLDPDLLLRAATVREFDNKYTAPLHGFSNADEYYTAASSRQYLRSIQIPTLVLHARDDPFMTEDVIPGADEVSSSVTLEVTEAGGHVGFISGRYPWAPTYWLEERAPEFLRDYLK